MVTLKAGFEIAEPSANRPLKGNVDLLHLPIIGDSRGSLVAIEAEQQFFTVRRVYYIFDTLDGVVRGKHAHMQLRQLLICMSGACTIDTVGDDGARGSFRLDSPTLGLQIEGLVWREMRDFTPGAVLAVLADRPYDESD